MRTKELISGCQKCTSPSPQAECGMRSPRAQRPRTPRPHAHNAARVQASCRLAHLAARCPSIAPKDATLPSPPASTASHSPRCLTFRTLSQPADRTASATCPACPVVTAQCQLGPKAPDPRPAAAPVTDLGVGLQVGRRRSQDVLRGLSASSFRLLRALVEVNS